MQVKKLRLAMPLVRMELDMVYLNGLDQELKLIEVIQEI